MKKLLLFIITITIQLQGAEEPRNRNGKMVVISLSTENMLPYERVKTRDTDPFSEANSVSLSPDTSTKLRKWNPKPYATSRPQEKKIVKCELTQKEKDKGKKIVAKELAAVRAKEAEMLKTLRDHANEANLKDVGALQTRIMVLETKTGKDRNDFISYLKFLKKKKWDTIWAKTKDGKHYQEYLKERCKMKREQKE